MITLDLASTTFLLVAVCGILCAIQLCYVFGIYNRIHRHFKKKNEAAGTELPPLSVIIVTKDSGSALTKNLPAILEQDYPEFEVIVINDKSAGEDENILKLLSDKYNNLYHTFIPETARYVSRKKLGIAMGIRASRYEWLVVTEPYCRPVSRNWLRRLSRRPSGLRKTRFHTNSLAHRTTWLRSDLPILFPFTPVFRYGLSRQSVYGYRT